MKRRHALAGAAVLAVAAAIVAWWLLSRPQAAPRGDGPPERGPAAGPVGPAEAESVRPETQAPAAADSEEAAVVAEAMESVGADIAVVTGGEKTQEAPVEPEVRALIARINESLGWDKISTMKCAWELTAGEAASIRTEMTMGDASKVLAVLDMKFGNQAVMFYVVTDHIFAEFGEIDTDGKRSPQGPLQQFNPTNHGGMSPLFKDRWLNPALYEHCETVKVEANDPLFQKSDGSPSDVSQLVVMRGDVERGSYELYVDPATARPVAMRFIADSGAAIELSRFKYDEVAEGVFYPVECRWRITGENIRIGPMAWEENQLIFESRTKDIEINPEIDPKVFHFSARVGE